MILSAKIGVIEFDEHGVRLVIVKTGGRRPTVLESHAEPAVYESPEGRIEAFVNAVVALKGRVKTKPGAYVLCASSRYSIVRAISVPFKGKRRVAAAVRFELEPYLAFPIDELVVDFATMREVDGQTQVLAVGMRRGPLEEQLGILQAAGIDPESIGLDAIGLTALWQAGRKTSPGLHAVLHVRPKGSILIVLNGKDLAFIRYLPVTLAQMHENPAAAARDAQNSLRAFRVAWDTGEDVAGLAVTGIELFEEERQLFEESLRIPVTYERLSERVTLSRKAIGGNLFDGESREGNVWEAPLGVALAGAGGAGFGLEFRQGELAQPNAFRGLMQHAVFSGAIALLALAGYIAYMYFDYRSNVAETQELSGKLWTLYTESFPDAPGALAGRPEGDKTGFATYEMFRESVTALDQQGQRLSLDMLNQPGLLDLLNEISQKLPNSKVTVTRIKYDLDRNTGAPHLTVEGRTTPDVFNQVRADLEKSTLFALDGEPSLTSDGSFVKFVVNMVLRGPENAQA